MSRTLKVSVLKRPCQACFSRLVVQGSAIAAFSPLAAQRYVLHRKGFCSSVCQAVAGLIEAFTSKVYYQSGKNVQVYMLKRVYQAVPFHHFCLQIG